MTLMTPVSCKLPRPPLNKPEQNRDLSPRCARLKANMSRMKAGTEAVGPAMKEELIK